MKLFDELTEQKLAFTVITDKNQRRNIVRRHHRRPSADSFRSIPRGEMNENPNGHLRRPSDYK